MKQASAFFYYSIPQLILTFFQRRYSSEDIKV